jgi:Tfp pilus assembly protein PilO
MKKKKSNSSKIVVIILIIILISLTAYNIYIMYKNIEISSEYEARKNNFIYKLCTKSG